MAYSAGRTEGKEGGNDYVGMEIVMEVKVGIPTLNLLRMNHDCEGKVGCIASHRLFVWYMWAALHCSSVQSTPGQHRHPAREMGVPQPYGILK